MAHGHSTYTNTLTHTHTLTRTHLHTLTLRAAPVEPLAVTIRNHEGFQPDFILHEGLCSSREKSRVWVFMSACVYLYAGDIRTYVLKICSLRMKELLELKLKSTIMQYIIYILY